MIKICENKNCNQKVEPKQPRKSARFCSRKCYYESRRVTWKCLSCNKEWITPKSQQKQFCNIKCRVQYAKKNGHWNEKKRVIVICSNCNKKIEKLESKIVENNFCNRKCYQAWWTKTFKGDNHIRWKGNSIETKCDNLKCNKIFKIRPGTYKRKKKENNKIFCSEFCRKEYLESGSRYDVFAHQISYAEPVKRNKNNPNILEVKCAYCGKWYIPLAKTLIRRIKALNGDAAGEQRLYCSTECKQECPIYRQVLWPKGFKQATSREVQPELRQMCLKRDNYTCQKCGLHQDKLDVGLHCHHIEGIRWEPIESGDLDRVITFCKNCHIKVHKQPDCGYNDMKCKK